MDMRGFVGSIQKIWLRLGRAMGLYVGFISPRKFERLLKVLIAKIEADDTFKPNAILCLSTGGFMLAPALAKHFGIRHVGGISVYKDADGNYHLEYTLLSLNRCDGLRVLILDDSSKRGLLAKMAVEVVVEHGGEGRSGVLIAWKDGIQPDYVAKTCAGDPADGFWERVTL